MRADSIVQALSMTALAMNSDNVQNKIESMPRISTKCAPDVSNNSFQMGNNKEVWGRRKALEGILSAAFVTSSLASPVNALDMDAFMNAELDADKKNCDPKRDPKCIPKLTGDEALCKYGQTGDKRSEACARVKKSGGVVDNKPQGKSLGGAYAM